MKTKMKEMAIKVIDWITKTFFYDRIFCENCDADITHKGYVQTDGCTHLITCHKCGHRELYYFQKD